MLGDLPPMGGGGRRAAPKKTSSSDDFYSQLGIDDSTEVKKASTKGGRRSQDPMDDIPVALPDYTKNKRSTLDSRSGSVLDDLLNDDAPIVVKKPTAPVSSNDWDDDDDDGDVAEEDLDNLLADISDTKTAPTKQRTATQPLKSATEKPKEDLSRSISEPAPVEAEKKPAPLLAAAAYLQDDGTDTSGGGSGFGEDLFGLKSTTSAAAGSARAGRRLGRRGSEERLDASLPATTTTKSEVAPSLSSTMAPKPTGGLSIDPEERIKMLAKQAQEDKARREKEEAERKEKEAEARAQREEKERKEKAEQERKAREEEQARERERKMEEEKMKQQSMRAKEAEAVKAVQNSIRVKSPHGGRSVNGDDPTESIELYADDSFEEILDMLDDTGTASMSLPDGSDTKIPNVEKIQNNKFDDRLFPDESEKKKAPVAKAKSKPMDDSTSFDEELLLPDESDPKPAVTKKEPPKSMEIFGAKKESPKEKVDEIPLGGSYSVAGGPRQKRTLGGASTLMKNEPASKTDVDARLNARLGLSVSDPKPTPAAKPVEPVVDSLEARLAARLGGGETKPEVKKQESGVLSPAKPSSKPSLPASKPHAPAPAPVPAPAQAPRTPKYEPKLSDWFRWLGLDDSTASQGARAIAYEGLNTPVEPPWEAGDADMYCFINTATKEAIPHHPSLPKLKEKLKAVLESEPPPTPTKPKPTTPVKKAETKTSPDKKKKAPTPSLSSFAAEQATAQISKPQAGSLAQTTPTKTSSGVPPQSPARFMGGSAASPGVTPSSPFKQTGAAGHTAESPSKAVVAALSAGFDQEREALVVRNEQLQQSLAQSTEENRVLSAKLKELQGEQAVNLKLAEGRADAQTNVVQQLQTTTSMLQQQVDELKLAKEKLELERDAAVLEATRCREAKAQAEGQASSGSSESEKWRLKYKHAEDERLALSNEVEEQMQTLRRLEMHLKTAQSEMALLKEEHSRRVAEIERVHDAKMDELRTTLEESKKRGINEIADRTSSEKERMKHDHAMEVKALRDEIGHLERMRGSAKQEGALEERELARAALDRLEQQHMQELQALKQTYEKQSVALQDQVISSSRMNGLAEKVEASAANVLQMQQRLAMERAQTFEDRDIAIKARERLLLEGEDRLEKERKRNEAERQRLQELVVHVDTGMKELRESSMEEKSRLAREVARLEAMQAAITLEKSSLSEKMEAERKKLEELRDQKMREREAWAQDVQEFKENMAAEKARLVADQQAFAKERIACAKSTAEAEIEMETQRALLERERAMSNEMKMTAERMRDSIVHDRQQLDNSMAALEKSKEMLYHQATQLQQQSEDLARMRDECNAEKERALAAQTQFTAEFEKLKAAQDKLQADMEEFRKQKKVFQAERVSLAEQRKQAQIEKAQLAKMEIKARKRQGPESAPAFDFSDPRVQTICAVDPYFGGVASLTKSPERMQFRYELETAFREREGNVSALQEQEAFLSQMNSVTLFGGPVDYHYDRGTPMLYPPSSLPSRAVSPPELFSFMSGAGLPPTHPNSHAPTPSSFTPATNAVDNHTEESSTFAPVSMLEMSSSRVDPSRSVVHSSGQTDERSHNNGASAFEDLSNTTSIGPSMELESAA